MTRAGIAMLAVPIVIGILNASRSQAQSPAAPAPKFEVASVRTTENCGEGGGREGGRGRGGMSPGRLHLPCVTAMGLITSAYVSFANGRINAGPIPPIQGGPSWTNSNRYEINAKAEDSNADFPTMMGPMMQNLLKDRFRLKIHSEVKNGPVYALVAAKNGPRLQPFTEGSCIPLTLPPTPDPSGKPFCNNLISRKGPNLILYMTGQTLAEFCKQISATLDRPVIDETKIVGKFNFYLEFAPDELTPSRLRDEDNPVGGSIAAGTGPPERPSIGEAILEKFRLKLRPAKGPREFFIIDHVEKPSEN
jgi:uncharacterized protein (TIGR03435 family)